MVVLQTLEYSVSAEILAEVIECLVQAIPKDPANPGTKNALASPQEILFHIFDQYIFAPYTISYHDELVLIMEYAEGGSLKSAINRRRLDWPARVRIAQEITRGLAYLHQEDILHRDLTSSNVLLTWSMEVKLVDFGLANMKLMANSMDSLTIYSVDDRQSYPTTLRKWIERCWQQDPSMRPEAIEMIFYDDEDCGSSDSLSGINLATSEGDLTDVEVDLSGG
ncbi:Dual specificity testis-specific protein kinase 2 [Actinomortierella ambigua]|uniref:Dual specificity testis-specific protein kinase 2 n=1 Tax=Actinomortierella ambigua TaxID=1343610 RepID=A0A9P6PV56_9FUNG|nr:Dual specificity testis-specific protein kinase 2 [Actinomortierella ambigua]